MTENRLLDDIAYKPCVNGCTEKGTEQPRVARHGQFCAREYRQAAAALKIAPELMEHMVSLRGGSVVAPTDGDKITGSRTPPAPGNEQALNDTHETYRRLVYWSALWANRMRVTAPAPAIGAWRDDAGTIVGLPDNVSPSGAKFVANIMTAWLDIHLESIFHLDAEDVNYWLSDLRDIFSLNARWPREQRPFFAKTPCPDDAGRIAVYPPRWEGDEMIYKCEKCGRLFTEDRFDYYARLFADIAAEKNPVKRHLMRKYAG